jgi:DNA-binding beta-propeller fold protein YncE
MPCTAPVDIAITPDGTRAYVTNYVSSSVNCFIVAMPS